MSLAVYLALVVSLPAPLEHALTAARAHSRAVGIARAQLAGQEAAALQALAGFTPVVQANGVYTRSQFETILKTPSGVGPDGSPIFQTVTINPYNSVTANVGISVPLVVPAAYARYAGARHGTAAAAETARASEADVLLSTARTYYQVVAAEGVVKASERALTTAEDGLRVAQARLAQGTETPLAVDRARVDVSRAKQALAVSRQTLGVSRRSLETLTGEPSAAELPPPSPPEFPPDDEAAYAERALNTRPELAAGRAALRQQEAAVKEAYLALSPRLTGTATEYVTNAGSFLGKYNYWTAGIGLVWSIDAVGTAGTVRRARAAIEEQRQRLLQSEDAVRDDVHTVWLEVEADRARLEAATSEAASASDALAQAKKQLLAGTATSLEVSATERDLFTAEASLAQVCADLAGALLALRKAAGESLLAAESRGPPEAERRVSSEAERRVSSEAEPRVSSEAEPRVSSEAEPRVSSEAEPRASGTGMRR